MARSKKKVRRLDNGIEAAQVRDVTGDRQPLAAGAPSREVGHHAMAMFPQGAADRMPHVPGRDDRNGLVHGRSIAGLGVARTGLASLSRQVVVFSTFAMFAS